MIVSRTLLKLERMNELNNSLILVIMIEYLPLQGWTDEFQHEIHDRAAK